MRTFSVAVCTWRKHASNSSCFWSTLSLNSFLQPHKQVAVEALELEQMAVEELALEQVAVEELEWEQAYEGGDILGSSAAQRHSACNVEANLNSALPLLCHTTSPFLVPLPPPSPPPHGYTHSTHHLHSLPCTTAAHHHCRRHHHQNVGIPTTWVYPLYPSLPVSRYLKFIFKLREASL